MIQSRGFIGRCAASQMTTLPQEQYAAEESSVLSVRLLMRCSSNGNLTSDKRSDLFLGSA
jgi:hypothetical protein